MSQAFETLLAQTIEQQPNDVLLLLFANAQSESSGAGKKQSGTIRPVMCVDMLPQNIASFSSLVREADGINKEWNFVLVASLGTPTSETPATDVIEKHLNKMVYDVENGADLAKYAIFDRDQSPVFISN
jgi:hypothetical protein